MSEELLINITPAESRVALVENGMLQEIYLERGRGTSYVGNVYKGRVSRVLPGMQAAFVDIGLERTAFLHASDIGTYPAEADELPPERPIQELLHEGSEVIVQVVKDPIGSKGARLTTHISIPSRYLVLLPNTPHIGVSVRIEDDDERSRLKGLVSEGLDPDAGYGYIVRTNAEGVGEAAIRDDIRYLSKRWQEVRELIAGAGPGDCVYLDLSLPLRAMRDLMNGEMERVRLDSSAVFEQLREFMGRFMPEAVDKIELYQGSQPIFDLYGVEDEIQRALEAHTPLKSGGYLIIEQTEALITVDVNTGAYVGHRNLEETIYKTNLEAAQAIARQLRLRNLGGIIIIDFIDMENEEHKRQVLRALERALERDHARTSVSSISSLGLVEMTRKRTTESLAHRLCVPCPVCHGRGQVKSIETVCGEVFREIVRASRQFEAEQLLVLVSPTVADTMLEEHSSTVDELERLLDKSIRFRREEQYATEQYDVVLL